MPGVWSWPEGGRKPERLPSAETIAYLTPAMEIGLRSDLANGWVLRNYVSAGLSIASQSNFRINASLVGASPGTPDFGFTLPLNQITGRVSIGTQVYATDHIDLRLEYDGSFAGNQVVTSGQLIASYRF